MDVTLVLAATAAYLVLVAGPAGDGNPGPAAVFGAVFVLFSVAGYRVARQRALGWRLAFALVQFGLGTLLFDTADASIGAMLLLVVLVVQAMLILPLPAALALTAAIPLVHVGMAWRAGLSEGFGTLVAVTFAAVVTWLLKREGETRRELAAANQHLAAFAAQAQELATTRERNRIARDIHDGLGHHLTVVQMQVKAGRAILAANPERAAGLFAQAEREALEALAEVRRSIGALRGPRHDLPLTEAVCRLAEQVSLTAPPTSVEVLGEPRTLPLAVEDALYRTVQEGLTNIRKHADAKSVKVVLDYADPATVRVSVADDGSDLIGSIPDGFGLAGLRERLAGVDGEVDLERRPGKGATLRAAVPG